MMRKRSIISLLLAFCLCFSMITPVMAAEVNAEAQIEAQAMSRLADFDFVQSADVNEATFSLDGESVLIQNLSETATLDEISKAELADVIEQVAEVRETEFDSGIEVIDYYCLIDDKVYFYEEAVNAIDVSDSKLIIFNMDKEAALDFSEQLSAIENNIDDDSINLAATDYFLSKSGNLNIENWYGPLDKGVAARLNVNKSSISFMEATLTAPKLDDLSYVDNENVTNYIYLGFHGSNVESDIGIASGRMVTGGPIVGFKPYFLLKNSGVTDGTDVNGTNTVFTINVTPDNSGVQYFLPSTSNKPNDITMIVYKDVQDSVNGRKGYIRGTISGNAVYGRELKQANVKVIMDATKTRSSQLKPITNWKIVNTLTPKEGYAVTPGAKSLTVFNNIKIDGQSVPLSICRGQIYNKGLKSGWGKIVQVDSGSNLGRLTFDVICGK